MYLVRLIYTSQPTEHFKPESIEDILDASRRNNGPMAVTGLMYFNQHYFLQCLEGSRSNVNKIYHRILNDKRHRDPIILDYQEIEARDFSAWEMGYLPETKPTRESYKRYSPTGEFSPYHMSGESCHKLMVELKGMLKSV